MPVVCPTVIGYERSLHTVRSFGMDKGLDRDWTGEIRLTPLGN